MSDLPRSAPIPQPDPHGQAALLLAESMLHALVEASVLSGTEALAAVTSARDVKAEFTGESAGNLKESLILLSKIAETFAIDVS